MARLDGQRFADLALTVLEIVRRNRFSNESFVDAFSRLIGLEPNINPDETSAQAGDASTRTQQQILNATVSDDEDKRVVTGQAGRTVVDGLLKSQDENQKRIRQLAAAYIENLIAFIERWGRQQRGQQIRRLQRLIGDFPIDPFDQSLIEVTPLEDVDLHQQEEGADGIRIETVDIAETVRKINEGLKTVELSKLNRQSGKLRLQLSLYNLVMEQLSMLISSIPQDRMGELGGAFVSIVKTPVLGIDARGRKLEAERRTVGVELQRLRQQSALILDGITLETGEIVSLHDILRGLLFLASKVEYKCKNCRFYGQGTQLNDSLPSNVARERASFGNICTYSFEEGTGRPTKPNFSCKEVWNRSANDFWTANEELIEKFKREVNPEEESN